MRIIFTCGSGGPSESWAGASFDKGIGGSEGCLIRLAEAFAALGHEVLVYNNCGSLRGSYKGVMYVQYNFADRMPACDLLISWRNWYLLFNKPQARVKWHWTHDIPVGAHHPCPEECARPEENALETIDRIVYLNNYHQSLCSSFWPGDKAAVFPIGVEQTTPVPDEEIVRDPLRCVTFYHPNRGLDVLRGLWPIVHNAVPEATLQSFWWEPEQFRPAVPEIGILPMRRVSQNELYLESRRSGIMPYPSTFGPEISPASTLVSQCGGAVPVVVIQGGMVDTVKYGWKTDMPGFVSALIEALHRSKRGDFEPERAAMMAWTREEFNWTNVAKSWIDGCQKEEKYDVR